MELAEAEFGSGNAQLRKVLNVMFPPSYIQLYHRPPNSVCSLLITKSWPLLDAPTSKIVGDAAAAAAAAAADCWLQEEASTEPSSRANLVALREQLNASLDEHQAKLVGLCPIRRAIYDQLFDELIRQVTVGCVEQGLLLFRVRNELRMTLSSYKRAYESGVQFGLSKAIQAELELEQSRGQIGQLEKSRELYNSNCQLSDRISERELRNKLETVDKLKEYYRGEIAKKDKVIEQQRAIIRALSRKSTGDIKSPI